MSKGDKTTVVQQPGAPVPKYELSPEEKELLSLQGQSMRTAMPLLESYIKEILPLERARGEQTYAFTEPILRGERLPGEYGVLGTPLGTDYENELFRQARRHTEGEMNRLGLLDSGVTAELLNKSNTQIAMDAAARRRAELSQLINLAMGIPLTGLPAAQTASGQATQAIMGQGQERRNYQMQAADLRNPKIVGTYRTPGWGGAMGGMMGQIGGTIAGVGASKFLYGLTCFAGDTLVESNIGDIPISKVKPGMSVMSNDGMKEVLNVRVHKDSSNIQINGTKTTTNHPMILEDGTLTAAKNLHIGDKLFGGIEVKSITHKKIGVKVYSLEVVGHKFYADGFLVHDGMEKEVLV